MHPTDCETYASFLAAMYIGETCTTGEVQLVGGAGDNEGRVEVCLGGIWGTVSDNTWNYNDVVVLCQQLGFSFIGWERLRHLVIALSIRIKQLSCPSSIPPPISVLCSLHVFHGFFAQYRGKTL